MRTIKIFIIIALLSGCSIYNEQVQVCNENYNKGNCRINAVIWTPIVAIAKAKKDLEK